VKRLELQIAEKKTGRNYKDEEREHMGRAL
jgi:hypothetical protein